MDSAAHNKTEHHTTGAFFQCQCAARSALGARAGTLLHSKHGHSRAMYCLMPAVAAAARVRCCCCCAAGATHAVHTNIDLNVIAKQLSALTVACLLVLPLLTSLLPLLSAGTASAARRLLSSMCTTTASRTVSNRRIVSCWLIVAAENSVYMALIDLANAQPSSSLTTRSRGSHLAHTTTYTQLASTALLNALISVLSSLSVSRRLASKNSITQCAPRTYASDSALNLGAPAVSQICVRTGRSHTYDTFRPMSTPIVCARAHDGVFARDFIGIACFAEMRLLAKEDNTLDVHLSIYLCVLCPITVVQQLLSKCRLGEKTTRKAF
jgi:hypothetical protein